MINKRKTALSVKGSKIIPNLETILNFLATTPSSESDKPIIAIIKTRLTEAKSKGEKFKKRNIVEKNLVKVIKFGIKKISLNFKEDL